MVKAVSSSNFASSVWIPRAALSFCHLSISHILFTHLLTSFLPLPGTYDSFHILYAKVLTAATTQAFSHPQNQHFWYSITHAFLPSPWNVPIHSMNHLDVSERRIVKLLNTMSGFPLPSQGSIYLNLKIESFLVMWGKYLAVEELWLANFTYDLK